MHRKGQGNPGNTVTFTTLLETDLPKQVILDGNNLTIEQVVDVARNFVPVRLAPAAVKRMNESRHWVEMSVKENRVVYGITTGFGALQNEIIDAEKLSDLQRNLILSHCSGVGEPLPDEVVRGMMLLRANALAKGFSGIRVSTVKTLLDMLNKRVHPVVPAQGSVGASGDLAPLSHMAAVMIGEGEAIFKGKRMPGGESLKAAGIKPVALEAKEGIALNNGTQAMTAVGVLVLYDAEVLADTADVAIAMSCEAIKGKSAAFEPAVHMLRPHAGQIVSARNIRKMIQGSSLVNVKDGDTKGKVQDSYSIRCAPQVHGASRDALAYVRSVLETEINSATDNPLIFADDDHAISAGNFHGQPVALAMDFLALAVAELGNISERRTAKLTDKNHSFGLPPFLSKQPGLHSGMMMLQYTAAALVSENKVLIHPASGDSIPTSANQEDHVSMGTIAARQAGEVVRNVRRILAIELLCAAAGLDFRHTLPGRGTRRAHTAIRGVVRELDGDRTLSNDVEEVAELIRSSSLADLLAAKD